MAEGKANKDVTDDSAHGAEAMADAMAHVLAKKPKKVGAPIMSRSKSTLEKLKQERRERRQKKVCIYPCHSHVP